MYNKLTNQVILITGASRGIGRADAILCSKQGAKLALTYASDRKACVSVRKECLKAGAPEVMIQKMNVRRNADIKNAVRLIVRKYRTIDVLVNNAGVVVWKPIEKQSAKEIENQLRTNLEGLIKVTQAFLPYINRMIINMASAASLKGYPDMISYCASKWGVRGFTQALALARPGLRIYDVISGGVATRMKNFKGMPPEVVSSVILDFILENKTLPSGSDINVRDYIKTSA